MGRHSKHSNDRNFYSHKERVDAGFAGTRKEIMGTDCFLPFGACALTLKVAKDPVATPDGYIFDREAILENLLQQKLDIASEKKKFAEQEKRKAMKEDGAKAKAEMREIEEFREADQGLLSQDARHKRGLENAADDAAEKKLRKGELMTKDKVKLAENTFWAPQCTPNAAPAELKKPAEDLFPKCPMSGKKLRVKDLIAVNFEVADHALFKAGGGKGVFCCAVSKHPITHQQAMLLKPSGQVVLETAMKDCVLKDMICPISSKKLDGPQDILKLQMAGTGFSAHNEVQAKSFSFIRSFQGDNATQQGHLPRAGFAGLH